MYTGSMHEKIKQQPNRWEVHMLAKLYKPVSSSLCLKSWMAMSKAILNSSPTQISFLGFLDFFPPVPHFYMNLRKRSMNVKKGK